MSTVFRAWNSLGCRTVTLGHKSTLNAALFLLKIILSKATVGLFFVFSMSIHKIPKSVSVAINAGKSALNPEHTDVVQD